MNANELARKHVWTATITRADGTVEEVGTIIDVEYQRDPTTGELVAVDHLGDS